MVRDRAPDADLTELSPSRNSKTSLHFIAFSEHRVVVNSMGMPFKSHASFRAS